jgi:hypothetical protein
MGCGKRIENVEIGRWERKRIRTKKIENVEVGRWERKRIRTSSVPHSYGYKLGSRSQGSPKIV